MPESIYAEGYLPDYFEPTRYWIKPECYREPIGNRSLEDLSTSSAQRYEQARVMGGGSSINGQVALRGLPSDYDEWEAMPSIPCANINLTTIMIAEKMSDDILKDQTAK